MRIQFPICLAVPALVDLTFSGHRTCCVCLEGKMANDLDRVRISAAELRAEATNAVQLTDRFNGKRQ